jgi:FlaA1/EpsC-like NDP-sugar epimerase
VGVSTDKACKPVNVMGMTKAIQERVLIRANLDCPDTRFVCVRYGNVLASRGSVIPLFHEQIRAGGPLTITAPDMTRFLLSLNQAVDTIFAALRLGQPGETFIPRVPAAKVLDIAQVLIGSRPIAIRHTGIRPGEKNHEILISEEEAHRVSERDRYYVIHSLLPELRADEAQFIALTGEYSSQDNVLTPQALADLLTGHRLMVDQQAPNELEMLR